MSTTTVPSRMSMHVVLVGFLLILVDGFDSATIAVVVPRLAMDWGLEPSAFTFPVAATNAGVAVGYMVAGWLSRHIGQRRALHVGLALAAAGSALSALVLPMESMPSLTVARIITGLGIGVVLPVTIAMTTALNPPHLKQRIAVIVTLGLASGIAAGGAVGRPILQTWGPAGMYWIAAAATVLVAALAAASLRPSEPVRPAAAEAAKVGVAALLAPAFRTTTVLLWTFSFLVFITSYLLTGWIPTILVAYGFQPDDAPIGLTYFSLGGVLGGLCLIALTLRLGIGRSMVVVSVIGAGFLLLLGTAGASGQALLLLVLGAGAGVIACQIGQLTMAVTVYPDALRTTGVGFAAALGRIGSVVGPGIGGMLIGLAIAPETVMIIAAAPVIAALVCAMVLAQRSSREVSAESGRVARR